MYRDYENPGGPEAYGGAVRPDTNVRAEIWESPETARPARRAGGWGKGALIYFSIFIGIILIGFAFRAMFSGWGRVVVDVPDRPYIARIDVVGTISGAPNVDLLGNISGYNHEWTLARIDDLIYDDNNKGLILFVDSPGGGVYESDELYLKLREYREATERPLYAVMGSMAASGGYYISAAAERICANRNTWTGSIGVTMGTMIDLSAFLDNYGVKTETITSGRNKAMGGYFDPMTDEQRAIFQGLVDEAYDQFTGIVAEERGLDVAYVRELADGRIYTAAQALENGLIDDISPQGDDFFWAFQHMQSEYDLFDCELVELGYRNNSLLGRLLGAGAEKGLSAVLSRLSDVLARGEGDIGAALRLAENNIPAPQYLYER